MLVSLGKDTLSCPCPLMISVESFAFPHCKVPQEAFITEIRRKHESDRGTLISLNKWHIGMRLCASIAFLPLATSLYSDWPCETDNLLTQDDHFLCMVIWCQTRICARLATKIGSWFKSWQSILQTGSKTNAPGTITEVHGPVVVIACDQLPPIKRSSTD